MMAVVAERFASVMIQNFSPEAACDEVEWRVVCEEAGDLSANR